MIHYHHAAPARKAQVASLDIILSAVALLLFIGIILAILPLIGDKGEPRTMYGGQVFMNIENLAFDDPASAFLSDYRIDEGKLSIFAGRPIEEIERIIFTSSDEFDATSCDICLSFRNVTQVVDINVNPALGRTYQDASHTVKGDCNPNNPCQFYLQTFVFTKPVLRKGSIMNLYVVVCKE